MADALVAADLHLALDVLRDLAAQVTLDLEVLVDVGAQPRDLFLGEVAHARVARHPGLVADLLRGGAADAEDVGERDLEPLLAGDVDTGDTSHRVSLPSPGAACGAGSTQMTRTAPWRRITLHFSHIFLTDGRTFMRLASCGYL